MEEKIYMISGLGADERVFQKLDLPNYNLNYVKWIKPNQNETLNSYAKRLSQQINDDYPILIGISFGGIMAIELAKVITTKKIILLSSVKNKNEIPFYYRLLGKINFHKLIPIAFLKSANWFTYWLFGINNANDKSILKAILHDMDSQFTKWALGQIPKWENVTEFQNLYHIQGNIDRLFPHKYLHTPYLIQGGGHFMTLNKHEEVSKNILAILKMN